MTGGVQQREDGTQGRQVIGARALRCERPHGGHRDQPAAGIDPVGRVPTETSFIG